MKINRLIMAMIVAWATAACAVHGAPAAGDASGGWFVIPTPPLGAMLMRMPDDAPIGSVARAAPLGEQPRLMASSGGRLIMMFRPTATVADGSATWPVRQISLSEGGRFTNVEPLRPLVTSGEPISLAAAGKFIAAVVRLPTGENAVMGGDGQAWTMQGPLEGFQPRQHALVFSWGDALALWQGYGDGSRSTIWRNDPGIRADPPWSIATLPALPGLVAMFEAGGQLMALMKKADGSLALNLIRANAASEVARLAGESDQHWIVPTGRGIAVVESDGKPLPRLACRVYSPTGTVLYEGPARTVGVVGGSELALLGLALSSLLAAVLIFVFRPESARRESIVLPANCALAGPATRAAAGLIDASFALSVSWLFWGWYTGGLVAAASPGGPQGGAVLLSAAGLAIVVCSITEALVGRSPGKAIAGCRVVSASGGRITFAQAVARNLVRFLCPPLGMAWMVQPPHRATGLFGTVVVIDLTDQAGPGDSGESGAGDSGG